MNTITKETAVSAGVSATKKVYFGVCGRFHAFSLAREMEPFGVLGGVYAVDKCAWTPMGVPRSKFHNRLDMAVYSRVARYLPGVHYSGDTQVDRFDNWLLGKLRGIEPGVLHGWNSHVWGTFQALRQTGWRLCCERSCPHNQFQADLLREEARLLGLPFHYNPERLERAIEELYLADVISTCSQYSASSYRDPALRSKVRVNPLGSNFHPYRVERAKNAPLRVLMVGNAFLRKGIHYLIEAFAHIGDPRAELWIRGEVPGEYRSRIKDSRVKIIPPLFDGALRRLYREATVFCLPSIDEGFGLVTLEALAYGLPLVVTEHVGARDVLNPEVSWTAPIRDPRALAEGIDWARQQDPERIAAAAAQILNRNRWRDCAERQVHSVYPA
jgi:glycosyltransferase involved in cell wall biosynthesis